MRTLLLPIFAAANALPAGASAQSAPDAHVLRRERGDVIEIREVPAPVVTDCRRPARQRVGDNVRNKEKGRISRRGPGTVGARNR